MSNDKNTGNNKNTGNDKDLALLTISSNFLAPDFHSLGLKADNAGDKIFSNDKNKEELMLVFGKVK